MDILEIGYKGFLLIVDIFIGIIIGEFLFVYFYFLLFYFLFDIFIECWFLILAKANYEISSLNLYGDINYSRISFDFLKT